MLQNNDFSLEYFDLISQPFNSFSPNVRMPNPNDIIPRRFGGEQSSRHPGQLTWPGYNGLPVLGEYYLIKKEEAHLIQPVKFFYFKRFDLNNEEDSEYYQWIMERIYAGWFKQIFIDRKVLDDKVTIYLEWLQIYSSFPKR
jgi:hypothetical protein